MSLLRILPPAVALLILPPLAAPAGAATLTWPGPAPCAGVLYFAFGGPGTWLVGNMDSAQDMPIGVGFSIYAQLPSPNVFRVTATEGNHSGNILRLDHPLLDGNPCAQPVVTRMLIPSDGGNFDLEYRADLGYWRIFDYNGMALGTQFNVLVNPAQAETCGGEIFSDGFE